MKKTVITLSCVLVLMGGYAISQRVNAKGSQRLLNAIQAVQPGWTKEEVREFMGREPSIRRADRVHGWMSEVVPNPEKSEYWYFFMGYPPRNLIIFFGPDEKVLFATWDST
jgi:hypothetical protein